MVLPLIIGAGVTVAAITLKSGIQAYIRYQKLSPSAIAALNGIVINNTHRKMDQRYRPEFDLYPGGFLGKMTEDEALLVLGISQDEIFHLDTKLLKTKHRQCVMQNHPDKGGSPYVAMKINQAKEILDRSYLLKK